LAAPDRVAGSPAGWSAPAFGAICRAQWFLTSPLEHARETRPIHLRQVAVELHADVADQQAAARQDRDAIGTEHEQPVILERQQTREFGGKVIGEGDTEVPSKPYQIAYRVMLPKKSEASNLLAPVAASTSHIAYGTLRMEPVFMVLGHAAGVAAKMAADAGKPVQEIDTDALRQKLRAQGAVLELKGQ